MDLFILAHRTGVHKGELRRDLCPVRSSMYLMEVFGDRHPVSGGSHCCGAAELSLGRLNGYLPEATDYFL